MISSSDKKSAIEEYFQENETRIKRIESEKKKV